jgi:hypothetical protein
VKAGSEIVVWRGIVPIIGDAHWAKPHTG